MGVFVMKAFGGASSEEPKSTMQISLSGPKPRYQAIKDYILSRIETGAERSLLSLMASLS